MAAIIFLQNDQKMPSYISHHYTKLGQGLFAKVRVSNIELYVRKCNMGNLLLLVLGAQIIQLKALARPHAAQLSSLVATFHSHCKRENSVSAWSCTEILLQHTHRHREGKRSWVSQITWIEVNSYSACQTQSMTPASFVLRLLRRGRSSRLWVKGCR